MYCENEHKNHKSIYYGDILPDINDDKNDDIKEYINKLKKEIKDIINKLKDIMKNIDIYYNIYNNIIDNYKNKKLNYEILQNINEFNNYNKIIIKDINEIINDKDINNKYKNIMNIYNKINNINNINKINEKCEIEEKRIINCYNNYIIGEFEIKENNKEIRIINSYEQYRKENNLKIEDEYINEEEIKENIEIIINDKNMPFIYLYKFKEKGKQNIKYIFKKYLTNTCCMFCYCSSLMNIDLSNFNTQNVTNMACMFHGCKSLTKEKVITNDKKILNL